MTICIYTWMSLHFRHLDLGQAGLGSVMLQFKSSILVETKQTFLIFGKNWVVPLFDGSGFRYQRDGSNGCVGLVS
ncbi:hypothetical protein RHGRI_029465 [Rhododendron griersonianum]|uniref:Uncharacterized protein n=1 Tax=Rhododendron griersonianum TaxID=479676 RepID=A0AAV6IKC8_9ERIC|nr:hypothetical protein RHGRI_029465 [Rhododendron griersonianum]